MIPKLLTNHDRQSGKTTDSTTALHPAEEVLLDTDKKWRAEETELPNITQVKNTARNWTNWQILQMDKSGSLSQHDETKDQHLFKALLKNKTWLEQLDQISWVNVA